MGETRFDRRPPKVNTDINSVFMQTLVGALDESREKPL
jgi:hypothetical protein